MNNNNSNLKHENNLVIEQFHGILNKNFFGTKNKTIEQRTRCYLTSTSLLTL